MEPLCRQYVLLRPPINYRLARRTIGFAKSFAPSRPQYAALSTHAPNSTMPKNSSTTSSSSVTQPLNAPLGPSPTRLDSTQSSSEIVAPSRYISSSVPAGAPLKGLNYFKGKEDPVAMEDRQYPEWLWSVLSIKEKPVGSKENSDPRIYGMSYILLSVPGLCLTQYVIQRDLPRLDAWRTNALNHERWRIPKPLNARCRSMNNRLIYLTVKPMWREG